MTVDSSIGTIDSTRAEDIRARLALYDAYWRTNANFDRSGASSMDLATCKGLPEVTNAERSALEVYDFVNTPPTRLFAYVLGDFRPLSTWPTTLHDAGTLSPLAQRLDTLSYGYVGTWASDALSLGRVQLGHVWASNMGDKRRSIRFRARNGHTYAGTYYQSAGDYCRVRMVKAS